MTESVRKRTSKWDVVAEPQSFAGSLQGNPPVVLDPQVSTGIIQEHPPMMEELLVPIGIIQDQSPLMAEPPVSIGVTRDHSPMMMEPEDRPSIMKDDDLGKDNPSNSDWDFLKSDNNQFNMQPETKPDPSMHKESSEADQSTKWSQQVDNSVRRSNDSFQTPQSPKHYDIQAGNEDTSKFSYMEPLSGNQAGAKDVDLNRTKDSRDKHLELSPPASPKRSWNMPSRSRSRSRSRNRSRSRSWSRCRSRSRSPLRDLRRGSERSRSPSYNVRRGSERWADRDRMGSGVLPVPCRDFAAGRCRRGRECKFLHEDVGRRQPDRHYRDMTDTRESRFERGRYSGHETKENVSESREQSDHSWDKSFRSNRSTERCYNFTQGRCHNGSSCRYVHHEPSSDSGWSMKVESRERIQDRRDENDASFGNRLEPPRKNVRDVPCRYFAQGRCKFGEGCHNSHQGVVPQDDRSGHRRGINRSNSPWNGPNRGDRTTSADTANSPWNGPNSPWNGPNRGDRTTSADTANSPWNGRNRGERTTSVDTANSSQWMSNDSAPRVEDTKFKPSFSEAHIPEENGHQKKPHEGSDLVNVVRASGQSFTQGGQGQYVVPQSIQPQNCTPAVQIKQLVPPMPFNMQMQQAIYPLPHNGQNQFMPPQAPSSFNINMQGQPALPPPHIGHSQQNYNIPPPHNGQRQQNYNIPPPHNGQNQQNFSISGQIQHNLVLPPQGQSEQNINHSAQLHQNLLPQYVQNHTVTQPPSIPQSFNSNEQLVQITATTANKQLQQPTSDPPITQKIVSTEEADRITKLLASLAQFSGSVALNPNGATGLPQLVQPISNSMEPAKENINSLPPGFEQNDSKLELQKNISSSVPLPVKSATSEGNPLITATDLVEKTQESGETALKVVTEAKAGHSKKEEQTDNAEADVKTDEESKKSKDAKAMRLFKCALVDFVKETLKPSWKEGHLSKEAHKTIVKKVVEKVTGAMQSANVPQTQEKIDLYLSYSKAKLTKLVQAYVEKYVKS